MSGFAEITRNGVTLLCSPLFCSAGIRHGFTTRLGGVSSGVFSSLNLRLNCADKPENVHENLRSVASAVGFDSDACAMTRQTHGDAVRLISVREAAFAPRTDCDAVISKLPGHALMSFGADCVTILISDRTGSCAAAVHAGWRGAVVGTVTRAVEALKREFGVRPCDMIAAIGPAISGECYEVGMEVADALRAAHGWDTRAVNEIMPLRGSHAYPDLRKFAAMRLEHAGIARKAIDIDTHCTFSEPELFWSHRRTGEPRGVQAAAIAVKL